MKQQQCLNCFKLYDANTDWQKFCSKSCRINYWYANRIIKCPNCEHLFKFDKENILKLSKSKKGEPTDSEHYWKAFEFLVSQYPDKPAKEIHQIILNNTKK